MKLLIDAHLLLWAAADMLPQEAVPYFFEKENVLLFSSASIWEIIIKKRIEPPGLSGRSCRIICGSP